MGSGLNTVMIIHHVQTLMFWFLFLYLSFSLIMVKIWFFGFDLVMIGVLPLKNACISYSKVLITAKYSMCHFIVAVYVSIALIWTVSVQKMWSYKLVLSDRVGSGLYDSRKHIFYKKYKKKCEINSYMYKLLIDTICLFRLENIF